MLKKMLYGCDFCNCLLHNYLVKPEQLLFYFRLSRVNFGGSYVICCRLAEELLVKLFKLSFKLGNLLFCSLSLSLLAASLGVFALCLLVG